jgi:alpha/beta superfamily hydrolase
MNIRSNMQRLFVAGPVGRIEVLADKPIGTASGVAIVTHPHPLLGGTAEHKIPQLLARCLRSRGFATFRPNFRGVGSTEGMHDSGEGETEDMLAIATFLRDRYASLPLILAGFSFGTYVLVRVAQHLADAGAPSERLILTGTAIGPVEGGRSYNTGPVPAGTLVVHGEYDDRVPLKSVLDWARPLSQPVTVIPGTDHFFTRKLHVLQQLVLDYLATPPR